MQFINLTAHDVNVVGGHTFPPSGTVARCEEKHTLVGDVNGISMFQFGHGETIGLPAASDGIIFIVSLAVAKANAGRQDLVVPFKYDRSTGMCEGFSRV